MGTQPAQHRPEHLYLPDAQRIFSLTLRATQGLLDSLFELMNVPLCAPDYIDGRPGLPSPQSMKVSQVEIAAIDPDFDRGYCLYP